METGSGAGGGSPKPGSKENPIVIHLEDNFTQQRLIEEIGKKFNEISHAHQQLAEGPLVLVNKNIAKAGTPT